MFKIKRPAIIGILVVLLVFTGYLQHQLTQQAQLKSSKDYQNHEMLELVNKDNNNDDLVEDNLVEDSKEKSDLAVDSNEEVDIIDSAKSDENQALEAMYTEASISAKNYFVEYRLSRDKLRASLVDRLDEIINNANTTEIIRSDAQKEIMEIGSNSEIELQIEGLIKAKGYDDAIVFLTNKDIKIVVSAVELEEQDMVKILDIVKSETEYETNNIKIMKKK